MKRETNTTDSAGMQREVLKQKQSQILGEINKLCKVCRESKSDVIVVSNEVGLGIVPDNALCHVYSGTLQAKRKPDNS